MAKIDALSDEAKRVLKALCDMSENGSIEGWRDVYLDNALARLRPMSETTFRAYLSTLSKAGVYRVVDGFAWGSINNDACAEAA